MKFDCGELVVVDLIWLGVIVNYWIDSKKDYNYDVYVRDYNDTKSYKENEIRKLFERL